MRELDAADLIVHAGDFVAISVLEELQRIAPVVAVHGNVDEPALRRLLPLDTAVDVEGVRLGIVHDAGPRRGRPQRLAARFPACTAFVYGHSHVPEVARHEGRWVLNPGSPTDRRRAPAATMIRLEISNGQVRPELLTVA